LIFIKEAYLNENEVEMIRSLISSIKIKIPHKLSKEIEHIIAIIGKCLSQYNLGNDIPYLTLQSLFLLMIQSATRSSLDDNNIKGSDSNSSDLDCRDTDNDYKATDDNIPVALIGLLRGIILNEETNQSDRVIDTKTTTISGKIVDLENKTEESSSMQISNDASDIAGVSTFSDTTIISKETNVTSPAVKKEISHTDSSIQNCKTSSIFNNAPIFFDSTLPYIKALDDTLGEILVHIGNDHLYLLACMYRNVYVYT
jgi:hypothetical protein